MRQMLGAVVAMTLLMAGAPAAQRGAPPPDPNEPTLGNWRGTFKSPRGDSPFIITIAKQGGVYVGTTTGLAGTAEIPLERVAVSGSQVVVETGAESRLGPIALKADLTADGNAMTGTATIAIGAHALEGAVALQRRARADVIQPQVEPRADYFVGRWRFEYVGGEFPPLSAGARAGTATFSASGAPHAISGEIAGDLAGKPYQDRMSIVFDPASRALAIVERRADATELVSVGSWRSPLAIPLTTSPVQAGGQTYQLRRVIQVLSDVAFDLTEEFSVGGGPFRRLGNGRFTKLP